MSFGLLLAFTTFNPTATSCHITYKAAKKTGIFNAYAFVSNTPPATVTQTDTGASTEGAIEPAELPASASDPEVDGPGSDRESVEEGGDSGEQHWTFSHEAHTDPT